MTKIPLIIPMELVEAIPSARVLVLVVGTLGFCLAVAIQMLLKNAPSSYAAGFYLFSASFFVILAELYYEYEGLALFAGFLLIILAETVIAATLFRTYDIRWPWHYVETPGGEQQ